MSSSQKRGSACHADSRLRGNDRLFLADQAGRNCLRGKRDEEIREDSYQQKGRDDAVARDFKIQRDRQRRRVFGFGEVRVFDDCQIIKE